MIPIYLSIEGLYSYRSKQEIYFEKLTQAKLFGIFGKVGSGKSSIIEAVSLALYGQTERLSVKESYHLMNLKSNTIHIVFDFYAGKENTKYRFTVLKKRHKKEFEKIAKSERAAYIFENNNWIPIAPSQIESIIGLSYTNFKRTVVIPQGNFMEFIKLKPAARMLMFKEIFGLEKYDLYDKTKILKDRNDSELNIITGKIEQIGQITDDYIEIENKKCELIEKNVGELRRNLEINKIKLELQNKLYATYLNLDSLKKEFEKIENDRKKIENHKKEIDEYNNCLMIFNDKLENLNKTKLQIENHSKNKKEIDQKIKLYEQEIIKQSEIFEQSEKIILEKDKYIQQIKDLENIIKIIEQQALIDNASIRHENGNVVLNEISKKIEKLKDQQLQLKNNLDEKNKKLPNIELLYNDKKVFSNVNILQKNIETTKKELLQTEKTVVKLRSSIYEILKIENISANTDSYIEDFSKIIDDFKSELESLKLRKTKIDVELKFSSISEQLKDGDMCPVCGSTEHPHKLSAKLIQKEALEIQHELNQKNLKYEKTLSLLQEIKKLDNELSIFSKQADKLSETLHSQTIERNNTLGQTQYSSESLLDKDLEAANILRNEIEKIKSEIENNSQTIARDEIKEKKYIAELQKISNDLITAKANIDNYKDSIELLIFENYANQEKESLISSKEKLKTEVEKAEKLYYEIKPIVEGKKKDLSNLLGQNENISELLKNLSEEHITQENIIDELLKTNNYESVSIPIKILEKKLDITYWQNIINEYYKKHHHISENIKNYEKELKNANFEINQYTSLKTEFELVESNYNTENEKLITQKALIKSLLERQKDLLHYTKAKIDLEQRANNIKQLLELFKANGFVDFVSTVYLHNICNMANTRFLKLTKNQLSLEVDTSNEFVVRDILNGGKIRSVKTLSGGQSFQVALCLALALCDSVSQSAENKQNFFFIDEGFGSLDKESLHEVFETLRQLTKENKIVGIISHVEALQDDIVSFIKVVNTDNGSVVL